MPLFLAHSPVIRLMSIVLPPLYSSNCGKTRMPLYAVNLP